MVSQWPGLGEVMEFFLDFHAIGFFNEASMPC